MHNEFPLCNLQIEFYTVDSVMMNVNEAFDPSQYSPSLDRIKYSFDFFKKEDEDRYMLPLWIAINGEEAEAGPYPYSLFISVTAFFRHDPSINNEATVFGSKEIEANCFMATYSLSRTILDDLTSKSKNGRYLLPLIDVASVIRRKDEERAGVPDQEPE
ncbi:MAG: hypothetical protein IH600_16055 [Bacteroidetes bacterium]|nr:hypothetical protein [Bacteroidota bacterium]